MLGICPHQEINHGSFAQNSKGSVPAIPWPPSQELTSCTCTLTCVHTHTCTYTCTESHAPHINSKLTIVYLCYRQVMMQHEVHVSHCLLCVQQMMWNAHNFFLLPFSVLIHIAFLFTDNFMSRSIITRSISTNDYKDIYYNSCCS